MDYLIVAGLSALVAAVVVYLIMRSRLPASSDPTAVFSANRSVSVQAATSAPASDTALEDESDAALDDQSDAEPTAEQLLVEADELYSRREYSDAADKYDEALSAAIEDKGQDDLLVATISEKHGDADLAVNGSDYDKGTIPSEYLLAFSIRERVNGPFHADLLPVLRKLIGFYDRFGAHHKAERLARRLREIEEALDRAKGETPPAVA